MTMKALSNIFAIIAAAALIWVCGEPKALDAAWIAGELAGIAVLIVFGNLSVYFDTKSKTIKK